MRKRGKAAAGDELGDGATLCDGDGVLAGDVDGVAATVDGGDSDGGTVVAAGLRDAWWRLRGGPSDADAADAGDGECDAAAASTKCTVPSGLSCESPPPPPPPGAPPGASNMRDDSHRPTATSVAANTIRGALPAHRKQPAAPPPTRRGGTPCGRVESCISAAAGVGWVRGSR